MKLCMFLEPDSIVINVLNLTSLILFSVMFLKHQMGFKIREFFTIINVTELYISEILTLIRVNFPAELNCGNTEQS